MARELQPYEQIERSLIKKYRKQLWNPFIASMAAAASRLSANPRNAYPFDSPLSFSSIRHSVIVPKRLNAR